MDKKNKYIKPEIEVIGISTEHIIAQSPEFHLDGQHNNGQGGAAGAKERCFWSDN